MNKVAFLNFRRVPKNELERGGRNAANTKNTWTRNSNIGEADAEPGKLCPDCRKNIPLSRLWGNQSICQCGHHFRMSARDRIDILVDKGSFRELFPDVNAADPLSFPGYQDKLEIMRSKSSENEAVICGTAKIKKHECCLFIMEPNFMMGSMGSAVGEKITRVFEYASENRLSAVGFAVSGGARMQEGMLSLMQMAKTSAAVKKHSDAGLFYLSVLTDPTTGGVTASFALLGDIVIAEPGATIGFAGARVIEQTTRKSLPKGFQKSEFMLEHGFVDAVIPRNRHRAAIANLLRVHEAAYVSED